MGARIALTVWVVFVVYECAAVRVVWAQAAAAVAVSAPPGTADSKTPDGKDANYWADQLSSDHFTRRKNAMRKLVDLGEDAVPALRRVLATGDLETSARVVRLLQLAVTERTDAVEDSAAWTLLQWIKTQGTSNQAVLADAVIKSALSDLKVRSLEQLAAGGISVGPAETKILGMIPLSPQMVVDIDASWDGRTSTLQWLRWLREVNVVRIRGDVVTAEVIRQVCRMPDLETLVLIDAVVDAQVLAPLTQLSRLEVLAFRYTPIDSRLGEWLTRLPVRGSLGLNGTGLSFDRIAELRAVMPGLNVVAKNGGLLGVRGSRQFGDGTLDAVEPGSAAEKAGLRSRDRVVAIDGKPIRRFAELVDMIGPHFPGEKVVVEYERWGVPGTREVTVTLGKSIDPPQ